MAKKFITMAELMEEFKELKKLDKVVSKIDWEKEREKYLAADEKVTEKTALIQSRIDELRNHEVIKMISKASEYGINPSGALDEWIQSWC